MGALGLPSKLRAAPLWSALAALAAGGALLWSLLPSLIVQRAAADLRDTLSVLIPLVRERAGGPPAGLAAWLREAASDRRNERRLRITLLGGDGAVLAQSAPAPAGEAAVSVSRAFADSRGRVLVLRLSTSLPEIRALRDDLAAALAAAAAAAGVAILATALWLDRGLFRPLAGLIGGAGDLAAGRARRVEVPAENELAALAAALNRLADTAEGQFAAVRKERDQLQIVLASMSEGVLVVGANGRALLANPAFCRLFDLAAEIAGRPVLELVRRPELARVIEDTLAAGQAQSGQIELQSPERRTLLLASAALSGGEQGAVLVVRDTTELTRVADMRRDFVANVSHELKTPLSAIRAYAETLRDGALAEPEIAQRFTERILWQCRRLQVLLADLLTLSRLETVARAIEREPVDLRALTRRAVELLAPAARERGIEVVVEERDAVPPVPGDADGLERVVVNLLDNAIKYNRPGGEVAVRLLRAGGEAVIEVADTGIGIPQEALARIFERFYRVDKGRSREEGGTGLGLAIVKHVAQAHAGVVEVESRMGRGSTFRVRLPLAAGGDRDKPAAAAAGA